MHGGPSQLVAGVVEGDVIAGKYRVDKILGAGGMGVVVAARHVQLDTKVAIKLLLPEMLSNREAVSRFAREARAAVRITGEHVARVLDVGMLATGAPYMVMEFLEGGDLAGWLQQRGALPVELAVDFVLQACVAVADAHALGIVHRDLKPANLFCVRRSDGQLTIKVIDFGISKLTDLGPSSSGMSMTRTSGVMGSPLYMSPEQMQSPRDVDALTDIWALGVVLFELLTRKVPFAGETYGEIAVKVATQSPPSMRALRPDVPAGLEAVIRTCLQADRLKRHRNVAELARALMPFGPRRARASVERISGIIQAAGLSASALNLPPSPTPPLSPESIAPVGHTAPGVVVRGRARVAGFIGISAILGAAAAIVVTRSSGEARPGAHPSAAAASPGAIASLDAPVKGPLAAPREFDAGASPAAAAPAAVLAVPPASNPPGKELPAKKAPDGYKDLPY